MPACRARPVSRAPSVPLSQEALTKAHVDVHGGRRRGVEVQHRRFHPNGARQIAFDLQLQPIDEARQLGGCLSRHPLHGCAIGRGDRGERSPLVNSDRCAIRVLGRRERPTSKKRGGRQENDGRSDTVGHLVLRNVETARAF